MNWGLYALAAFCGLAALSTIAGIGKTRKPVTPGTAVAVVLIDAALIVFFIAAARRLS